MPFKDYQKKLEYNRNYVHHYRNNEKGFEVINLNGIKNRNYVCETCFEVGNTQFHELTNNPKDNIELCFFCHDLITRQIFDDTKAFEGV